MKKEKLFSEAHIYVRSLVKWLAIGLALGIAGGVVGGLFHEAVELAARARENNGWLIWLMPLGGLLIVAAYRRSRMVLDTNVVIRGIRTNNRINWVMAPLIFFGSVVSHLVGASVGREGAALQIGGVLGSQASRILRLDEEDRHVAIMCGMSAVFAANFGTPLTAAFFALEVTSVGVVYYVGLVPCLVSALVAAAIAEGIGVEPFNFGLSVFPESTPLNYLKVIALGAACAALAIIFCRSLRSAHRIGRKFIKNDYLRVLAGSALALLLSWLAGMGRYNGAGTDVIYGAVAGTADPADFIIKMAITVVCISVGFKGGEIIPTLFIGSAFGCAVGGIIGLDPGFSAAVCMAALFCGMVNCPIASILLSAELFGTAGIPFFAVACAVSLMLSGNYSLYHEQNIVYSKIKARYINEPSR